MADRALEMDPVSPFALVAKALAAYRSRNWKAAINWAQKCSADNRQAKCVLALAHAQLGGVDLARQELAKMTDGYEEPPIRFSLRRNDAGHEAAYFRILLEEVKRKLTE